MKNLVQMGQRNQPSSRTNDSVSAAWHRGSRSPHRFRWTISCSCVWLVADATKTMALWVLDSHFQLQRSWRNRTGPVTSLSHLRNSSWVTRPFHGPLRLFGSDRHRPRLQRLAQAARQVLDSKTLGQWCWPQSSAVQGSRTAYMCDNCST